jgi:hypothetical protein
MRILANIDILSEKVSKEEKRKQLYSLQCNNLKINLKVYMQ